MVCLNKEEWVTFIKKIEAEKDIKVGLVPTPKLEKVRQKILKDVEERRNEMARKKKYYPSKIVKALAEGEKIKKDWWAEGDCVYLEDNMMRIAGNPNNPNIASPGKILRNIYEEEDWVVIDA